VNHTATRARAFTLVELMLAVVVSTLVIAAALAMFFTFERSDRALERRFDDAANLERVHFVVGRALSTIVVSDSTRAAGEGRGDNPDSNPEDTPPDAGSILNEARRLAVSRAITRSPAGATTGTTPGTIPGTVPTPGDVSITDEPGTDRAKYKPPPSPPRILLESAGSGQDSEPSPQRLELVLMRSPVGDPRATHAELEAAARHSIFEDRSRQPRAGEPRDRTDRPAGDTTTPREGTPRDSTRRDASPTADARPQEDESEVGMEDTVLRAVRGSFELRRQTKVPTRADGEPETRPVWELWWVPLAPRTLPLAEAGQPGEAPVPAGTPTHIASNIVALQWRAFDDREFKTRYAATTWNDLPAYFDVKIETLSGLSGHWLFEVDSVRGQEISSGRDRRDAARASNAVNRANASSSSSTGSKNAGEGGGK
jgi:type II secretory pathway pseudopilin PulG